MYEQVGIMKQIAITISNWLPNSTLVLRTIILVFGVTAVVIIAPRSVSADIVLLRTDGDGHLIDFRQQIDALPPLSFRGKSATFEIRLNDLNDFYIDIVVTGIPVNGAITIELDEGVLNKTGVLWSDYHFTLGTGGFGLQNFVESGEMDNLFFLTGGSDAPVNYGEDIRTGKPHFENPPGFDEPDDPDNLTWVRGATGTGVAPNQDTPFLVKISVPDSIDTPGDGSGRFTLRQRASVPEPTTLLLLGTGLAGVAIKMRKRLKNRKSG